MPQKFLLPDEMAARHLALAHRLNINPYDLMTQFVNEKCTSSDQVAILRV